MRALSLKQPWANAIAKGYKTIESRKWQTNYRGDLLICSSLKPDSFLIQFPKLKNREKGTYCEGFTDRYFGFNLDGYYQFGKAICIVELYNIEKMTIEHEAAALCKVYVGAYAWHFRNIRPISPFAVKGELRLFNVNDKLIIE